MIIARIRLRRPDEPPDLAEIEKGVRNLDRELDAQFLGEVAPALDRARRARGDAA